MSNRIFHMLTNEEDINYVMKTHNLSYEDILLSNPTLRGNGHLGQIIYIDKKIQDLKSISFDKNDYYNLLILQRLDTLSYINKYNDHSLIEDELFLEIEIFLSKIIDNDIKNLLLSIIQKLHKNIHVFIDEVSSNQKEKINLIRNDIKENISTIIGVLNEHKYNYPIEKIFKDIEIILLSSVKLISKDFYESFKLIKKI